MASKVIVTSDEELVTLFRAVLREELERARAGELVDAKGSGLGVITFRRLVREGVLRQASKVGRRLVVPRAELDRYLAEQRAVRSVAKPAPAEKPEHDPIQQLLDSGRLQVLKGGA